MEENNQNKEPLNKDFKVPKLRFKGFVYPYCKRKLNDIAEVISGGTPDTSNKSYWDGEINWFTPTEIGLGKYVQKSERKITLSGLNDSSARIIPSNSILMTSRASIGLLSINLEECTTNQGFQSLVPKNIVLDYLYYFVQTSRFQNKLYTKSTKSTFREISHKEVQKLTITIPNSRDEQEKVGSFLNYFDKKISIIEEKINILKKYKEGLVNLCFCDGKRYKISSFVKQVEKRNKDNQILTVYSISNKKGFISQTEQFDGNEVASTNKTNYKIVRKNEFAYNPARVNVGSIAYLEEEIGQISPMYIVFSIHGISNILLDEYFHSIYFRKELRKHLEGSVRQSLSFENLCDFNINISNFCESFSLIFEALNCKLSILEKTLLDLKKIKSYLLENMFI